MNFKYFFIIVVFLQAALTWLKAGIVTTHPEHENHELVIAKDESVVFEITPDSGDVITALIVTPSGPETTGTGSPLTATFQAGTEGQVYTCTLTVTHTDGDETCTAGKDFIYKVYVPVITLVNVDNLDTKSTYVKYEDTLDSIVSVKGSGDVQLKATVLPDAQKVKSLLSWTGATVDQNDKTKAKKSRTTSERADVSVSLTGHPDIKRDAKLWIAWVTLSFDNTGPKPDDSSVAPPTFGASSGARNGCLIQGTITPSGLGDKSEGFGVKYDLRRTIQAMTWYRADGLLASWIPGAYIAPGTNDDTGNNDEDLTPENDHIYVMDKPGWDSSPAVNSQQVTKMNAKEFCEIKIGTSDWVKASDDFLWQSQIWVEKVNNVFQRKSGKPNEIAPGSTTIENSSYP